MSRAASTDSERPDLAIFIPSYAGGGGERVSLFVARALADAGLRVDLVVARGHGELRDEPLPGVNQVDLNALNEILAAPAWIRYLKRARPRCAMSMIHTANFNSGIGARFVPDVPVIVNLRIALDCDPAAQWWFRSWFGFGPERALYKRAARVVGVSRGVAEEAARLLELPPDKVLAIPNPRQSRETSPNVAPEHERFFDKPVVLGVGRLAPQKDFAMLVHAFAEVAASRDVHLVVLGEGPERAALLRQAKELGVGDRVFLPGFVPNPQAYLHRARVFALSSRNEGFPGALIEAMDAGAAIVSTDCPFGPSEILDGERFGRLVPVGDAAGFATALGAELDSPDPSPEARNAERADWMRQFDPDVITGRYLEVVREVVAEG
ncbi:MAG: glycosyltransferase [Myxococcales bacterium]|nr:MAG: glycosyltransferase [Myxococcales bacterium]